MLALINAGKLNVLSHFHSLPGTMTEELCTGFPGRVKVNLT
jgi:hypothetical protein